MCIRRYNTLPSHRSLRVCCIDSVGYFLWHFINSYATLFHDIPLDIALVACIFVVYALTIGS